MNLEPSYRTDSGMSMKCPSAHAANDPPMQPAFVEASWSSFIRTYSMDTTLESSDLDDNPLA